MFLLLIWGQDLRYENFPSAQKWLGVDFILSLIFSKRDEMKYFCIGDIHFGPDFDTSNLLFVRLNRLWHGYWMSIPNFMATRQQL